MKHTFKKVAAVVLAVIMCVSAMVPAFATTAKCPGSGVTHTPENCTYTIVSTTPATCDDIGTTMGKCSVCQKDVVISTTAALGHDWAMPEAACKPGAVKTCKRDGCNATMAITGTDHKYTEFTLASVAECVAGERIERKCTVCGELHTTTVPDEGHYFVLVSYTAPSSCKTDGVAKYACAVKNCGATKEVAIKDDLAKHTYVDWDVFYKNATVKPKDVNAVAATCATAGTKSVVCKDCGRVAVIAIPATGDHDWIKTAVPAKAPTCTEPGYISYYYCLDCRVKATLSGGVYTIVADKDVVVKAYHDRLTTYAEVLPTCLENGTRIVQCSNPTPCTYTATITLEKKGAHLYYPDVAASDKDTQDALLKELGITGTAWADLDNFPATSTATPTGDMAKVWANYKVATCTEDASVDWLCLNCAYSYKNDNYTQCGNVKTATPAGNDFVKFGHKFDKSADAATAAFPAATCTKVGVEKYTCQNGCGYYKTVNVAAKGHRLYVDKTDAAYVAATCKTAGTNVIKCYDCTEYKETETVASTGTEHSYKYLKADGSGFTTDPAEIAALLPKCTTPATVTRACTVEGCDKAAPEVVTLEAKGHTYMDVKNATVADKLAKLAVNGTYTDTATGSVATCIAVGGCENGAKYSIKCADCAMFTYHEVTEGFGGGHVKVYINGTAIAATCTTAEKSNAWYCKNSYCENYFATYAEAVADMANTASSANNVNADVIAAPHHNFWDAEKNEPKTDAVTYKDVPVVAIKDAKTLADAQAVKAPVDKGIVTRYVEIPGTTLIWVFAYEAKDHTEASVTKGGFYCTDCGAYAGADKVVYTAAVAHDATTVVFVKKVNATCQNYGYDLYACNVAGCYYEEQRSYVAVTDHNDTTTATNQVPADCTHDGYVIWTCTYCDRVRVENIKATGHVNALGQTLTHSCTDIYTQRLCVKCNVSIDKNQHASAPGTICPACKNTVK